MVRAHASLAEVLQFKSDPMPWLNARLLFTLQQIGTWRQHWRDKGGEERSWPPYLTCRWLRKSTLSNRHSPTYKKYTGSTFTFTPFCSQLWIFWISRSLITCLLWQIQRGDPQIHEEFDRSTTLTSLSRTQRDAGEVWCCLPILVIIFGNLSN